MSLKIEVDKDYCMSSFLMYRRVVDLKKSFCKEALPKTVPLEWEKVPISNSRELEDHLRNTIRKKTADGKAAIALSGGIDSAILAKMMPKGSTAYTFRCVAKENSVDETKIAAQYAKECGLIHKIIDISWDDMLSYAPLLMKNKFAPIHSIEVQIYCGGINAKKDGFERMIYGETADVNYGGLSNILSREWHQGEFIERYAYLKPWLVLKNPKIDFSPMLEYVENGYMNVHKYLANFDIIESINSYINACDLANIEFIAPFANTYLAPDLDMKRIRAGENKYLIREIFNRLYPGWDLPEKLPMPRAVDQWLAEWDGPKREEFLPHCVDLLNGDEKWMVWSLEQYLNSL